ncbi:MAG: SIR2 family protein [Solirubrobacterales bacterium]
MLTTNYDEAIERSVEEVGKEPIRISLDEERIGERPQEGQVFVVHLHGVTERPETMVLTTAQRGELLSNDAYRSRLRALLSDGRLLVLGLRLSAEEPHLRVELRGLRRLLGGRAPVVILPNDEVDDELRILNSDRDIELHHCDPAEGYLEVRQCAQLLAPRQIDPTEVIADRASGVAIPFLSPPLLGPEQLSDADSNEPAVTVMLAESRLGSLADVREMADAQRALLVGAPGRGKTTALRRLGEENKGRAVLCDLRNLRLDPEEPERGFARLAAREGLAFDEETPVPSNPILREGSFVFLLDGFEEAVIEDHAGVAEAILKAAERWPQHSYVVTTRPTSEAQRLLDAGFAGFVVEGTEGWGNRYLRACGITSEQIEHLYDVVPTIRSQLAIPRYATRIAQELHEETEDGVELSRGALQRLVRGERKNLEVAAQRLGVELNELMNWAGRLAVMIELRGENSASVDEIAALSGPEGRDSRAACEELIQAALLQDLPDRARFSAQASQEALCAEAILRSEDPLAVLREVCLAEIDGRLVFRDDIEHTIDLVFEGAAEQMRSQLRELDEMRWARTQGPGDPSLLAEAIDVIWGWHREKRLWIPYRGDNQLRGPGEALKTLHLEAPEVLEARREKLNAECRSEERTIRGNAIEMLTLLPADEETEPILRKLIADPDDVVRRHAAHAIEHFGLSGLTDDLWTAWEGEQDELALEAIGLALGALCKDHELRDAISLLREKAKGWQRISYRFLQRIDLSDLAALLASGSVGLDDAKEVLNERLETDTPFSGGEVEALGRILIAGGYQLHRQSERIVAIVTEHPEEALTGAQAAAGEETGLLDLLWASDLDPDLLARYAEGPLAEPIERLLERIAWRDQAAVVDQMPEAAPEEEKPEDLATLLAEGDVNAEGVPADPWLWKLPKEPKEVQEAFLGFAEGWYPENPEEGMTRRDGGITVNNGFRGAVMTWAALNQPLTPERWLDTFGSGIASFDRRISEWLAQEWREDYSAAARDRIARLEHPTDLAVAAKSIPSWDAEICGLFAEKACQIDEESLSATVLERLRENGSLERLREMVERSGEIRDLALHELAISDDLPAQRELLEQILETVEAQPNAYEHARNLGWITVVTSSELVGPLGAILRATHHCEDASMFRRIIEAGIRSIGHESCLRLYDCLIADTDLEGGQFYWYQRETLARSLARQEVLARFEEPQGPVETVFEVVTSN